MSTFGDIETSHQEGRVTSAIEKRTAAIPSLAYLLMAGGSIAGSLALFVGKRRLEAVFVGMWAPTFLILGLYNKIVKEFEPVEPAISGH